MALKKNLVVFDIDGTLMHSAGHDEDLFREAHAKHVGKATTDQHWGNFTHMTDHAINTEFFERIYDRPATIKEVEAIKGSFFDMMKQSHVTTPENFTPVPGSIEAVNRLLDHDQWSVCFASGGWGVSSSFKLSTLGIHSDDHPAAFGDIHSDRLTLVSSAMEAARQKAGVDAFDQIVSIGDAIWDVETARKLGLPFIGVASWVPFKNLQDAGASHVIHHYEDYDHFEQCLYNAEVPR